MIPYKEAERINSIVNNRITPESDVTLYNKLDYWQGGNADKGDCEEYALAKQEAVIEAGGKPEDAMLVLCKDSKGEGHLVLYVDTDKGGYILDNLHPSPISPSLLTYEWLSICRGGKWERLLGWQ